MDSGLGLRAGASATPAGTQSPHRVYRECKRRDDRRREKQVAGEAINLEHDGGKEGPRPKRVRRDGRGEADAACSMRAQRRDRSIAVHGYEDQITPHAHHTDRAERRSGDECQLAGGVGGQDDGEGGLVGPREGGIKSTIARTRSVNDITAEKGYSDDERHTTVAEQMQGSQRIEPEHWIEASEADCAAL